MLQTIHRPSTDTRRQLLFAIVVFTLAFSLTHVSGNEAVAQVSDKFLPTWVARRVKVLDKEYAERPFEKIGWANDLESALQMGKEHNRPVFIFTHNGRLHTGRC